MNETKSNKRGRSRGKSSGSKKSKKGNKLVSLFVPKSIRAEAKTVDTINIAGATNFDSAGHFQLCNGMAVGSDIYQHSGRRIQMRSIRVKGAIYLTQAGAAPSDDYLRVMLVYDKQANGALPSFADILSSVDNTGTASSTAIDALNPNNYERFVVLRDEFWKVDFVQAGVNQPAQTLTDYRRFAFDWFTRLNNAETHYNGTGSSGVAGINTGSLFLFWAGLNNAANHQYGLSYQTRLRFVDL